MSAERKALVIVIDAARRDDTHAALAASEVPALAGAATGTLIAPSCWTLPSVASMLTGLFPAEHGMTWPTASGRCEARTIADLLHDAGRSFRLLSGNDIYAPPAMSFPPGSVDFPRWRRWRPAAFLGRSLGVADYGSGGMLREVRRMAANRDIPDLLVLHLQETHHPYLVPPAGVAPLARLRYGLGHLAYYLTKPAQAWEYAAMADDRAWETQRARYRACIDYAVGFVEEVLRAWQQATTLEESLVIVTSDHGEHFGEHGLAGHQGSLHEELVRCPCALIAPGLEPRQTIPGQYQHTDLLLTICRFLGIPCSEYAPGWQPLDMLAGAAGEPGHEYAFSQWASWGPKNLAKLQRRNPSYDFAPLNRDLKSVRTDRWKYIAGSDGSEALYDLREQPLETRNRLAQRPEVAAELRAALGEWTLATGGGKFAVPISSDSRGRVCPIGERRLKELGYI